MKATDDFTIPPEHWELIVTGFDGVERRIVIPPGTKTFSVTAGTRSLTVPPVHAGGGGGKDGVAIPPRGRFVFRSTHKDDY